MKYLTVGITLLCASFAHAQQPPAPSAEDMQLFAGSIAQQRNSALDHAAILDVEIAKLRRQLAEARKAAECAPKDAP